MSRKTEVVRVRVELEVTLAGAWGPDCTLGQIHDQAAAGALGSVRRKLAEDATVRIIGATAVEVVTREEGK